LVKSKDSNWQSPPVADNGAGISDLQPQESAREPFSTGLESGGASPVAREEERQLDYSLRPHSLAEFVGQERLKKVLGLSMQAARQRGEVLDHVLFSAPPGLGKTSLAHIIARELGVNLRVTSGPAIERAGDLAAIVNDLDQGDVLFIDEIHRLARGRRDSLSRHGGLRAQPRSRQGAGRAHYEALGQAVYDDRGHHPLGPPQFSAA
jgi:hypothetical protein